MSTVSNLSLSKPSTLKSFIHNATTKNLMQLTKLFNEEDDDGRYELIECLIHNGAPAKVIKYYIKLHESLCESNNVFEYLDDYRSHIVFKMDMQSIYSTKLIRFLMNEFMTSNTPQEYKSEFATKALFESHTKLNKRTQKHILLLFVSHEQAVQLPNYDKHIDTDDIEYNKDKGYVYLTLPHIEKNTYDIWKPTSYILNDQCVTNYFVGLSFHNEPIKF